MFYRVKLKTDVSEANKKVNKVNQSICFLPDWNLWESFISGQSGDKSYKYWVNDSPPYTFLPSVLIIREKRNWITFCNISLFYVSAPL